MWYEWHNYRNPSHPSHRNTRSPRCTATRSLYIGRPCTEILHLRNLLHTPHSCAFKGDCQCVKLLVNPFFLIPLFPIDPSFYSTLPLVVNPTLYRFHYFDLPNSSPLIKFVFPFLPSPFTTTKSVDIFWRSFSFFVTLRVLPDHHPLQISPAETACARGRAAREETRRP